MNQVKNFKPIKALGGNNLIEIYFKILPKIIHLRTLGSIVYVFIYKEYQTLKSEKFETRALKSTLVGYNRHTIYKVFIQAQNKVI